MADNKTPAAPQDEEYAPDLITLEDEDGAEHTFEVLDAVDHKNAHYLALVPYVTDEKELLEQDLDLILMKVGQDEEGEYLDIVEDDEELCEISEVFQKRLSEFYDIEG